MISQDDYDFASETVCQKMKDATLDEETRLHGKLDRVVNWLDAGHCVKDDNRPRVSSDVKQVMRWLTTEGPYGGWQVDEQRSEMDGSPTVILSLDSPDSVEGWLESAKPSLVIRCLEHKTSVYIVTGMGAQPVQGAYDEYSVEVRFDEEKPATQWWTQSTDSKALFATNTIALARRLAKANRLRFRFPPFNASPAIATFDLRGLDRLLPKVTQACSWR